MITRSLRFDGIADLQKRIPHWDKRYRSLLIQVFMSEVDKEKIASVQRFLNRSFQGACVIGATTDGIIDKTHTFSDTNLAVFSFFTHTDVRVGAISYDEFGGDEFEAAKALALQIGNEETKVVLAFAEGIHTNGELFSKGITHALPQAILAGGLAGDNGVLEKTYVFSNDTIVENGAVAVGLNGQRLRYATTYNFDWMPIGKEMLVDKSVRNRVYEIDGMSAVDIYAKYMGRDLANMLPRSGIEFPLIFEKDGVLVGRAVIAKHNDGSLTFAGNVEEGKKVRFGVGNADLILRDTDYNITSQLEQIDFFPESVFSYSCMARRRFLEDYMQTELEILSRFGELHGFFTYGEFFSPQNGKSELLNETMTLIALSEGEQEGKEIPKYRTPPKRNEQAISTVHVLANLANTVSKELEEANKELEKRVAKSADIIYKQAYFDKLTGLPNRLSLINRLQECNRAILFLINIDDFTSINDFYGYGIGDEVLKKMAGILQKFATTQGGEIFKLPSDEFAILLHLPNRYDDIKRKIEEILLLVEQTDFKIGEVDIYVSVAIAAAVVSKEGNGLAHADIALKAAKKQHKNYIIHQDDVVEFKKYEYNIKTAKTVKEAIDNSRIVPFYQPIYDLKTQKAYKYEVLARLQNARGDILLPKDFLELSQKIKLYPKITRMIIEKSFAYFAEHKKHFSVNLAFEDILNQATRRFILEKIRQYEVETYVTVEILETQALTDEKAITRFLDTLNRLGVRIAIDDFGSGFANFEYLVKIKADFIKIDGSLIRQIDTDANTRAIVETIVTFAKKLGKKTVAEFVHSKNVYDIVRSLGIDYAQGFFLGKPSQRI